MNFIFMSRHNDGRPILAYETTYRNETQKRVATFPMKLGVRARGRKRGRREGGSFVFFFFFFFFFFFWQCIYGQLLTFLGECLGSHSNL